MAPHAQRKLVPSILLGTAYLGMKALLILGSAFTAISESPPTQTRSDEPPALRWREELKAWIDSGEVVEIVAQSPSAMGMLVLDITLARGDVKRATEILAELPDAFTSQLVAVANLLRKHGELARAIDLYMRAFEEEPKEEGLLEILLELAPQRALEELGEWDVTGEVSRRKVGERTMQALLLDRLGRTNEAVEILLWLLGGGRAVGGEGEAILAEHAPARTEKLLLDGESLGGGHGTGAVRWEHMRFDLLVTLGRSSDIVDRLFKKAARGRDVEYVHEKLLELAPQRWTEHLKSAVEDHPRDGDLLARLGDCTAVLGDEAEAVQLWLGALEHGAYVGSMGRVFELAPELALPILESSLEGVEDDDDWGTYGDLCWKAGYHSEAQGAWQRALALCPEQEDWFDRLQRAALGSDPLLVPDDRGGLTAWWGW